VVEFARYSSADEAVADAAQDAPTRTWELTGGISVGGKPRWQL
jgi:hypothetical protein